MANREAHRQEVGVISSGSYQSHFLYSLSELLKEGGRREKACRQKKGKIRQRSLTGEASCKT